MNKLIQLRNGIRVIAVTGSMLTALVLGGGIAKANINFSGGNSLTGPNSANQNNWNIAHSVDVSVQNQANANNDQMFSVETGRTNVNNNTKVEDLTTGDIFGSIHTNNSLNSGNISLMNPNPGNVSFSLLNGTTGPNSDNQNNVALTLDHNININNTATLANNLNLQANSGKNNVHNNTLVGDVSSGNIDFNVSNINKANTSMGSVDLTGLGGFSVNGNMANEITGPQSTNTNNVNVNDTTTATITNNSDIQNNTSINANSGCNNLGNNTVAGNLTTGSVHLDVSTVNQAN